MEMQKVMWRNALEQITIGLKSFLEIKTKFCNNGNCFRVIFDHFWVKMFFDTVAGAKKCYSKIIC
jgi:hypothetical protein